VVLLAPLLIAAELHDGPPPIRVNVDGRSVLVDDAASFGQVTRASELHARTGKLFDVEGIVLDPRFDPGNILLNGAEASRSAGLEPGDAITVVDGTDETEGTRRETERLPGRSPGNPQYTLASSRVMQITTVGRLSGKVVSVRYQTLGKAHAPPAVALTFDDGPWPDTTLRILQILDRMHVKATFFMVGYLAERHPDIVQRVERAGMTIGTHSWSHPYRTPFRDLTPHRIQTEVTDPATLLEERFGIRPYLFRAPGGSYSPEVINIAQEAGMRLVQWSVDPHDYSASVAAEGLARAVLRAVRPGSIVLLHDGGGDASATIRALPRIIRGIRQRGLELVAIPR
jgi:peptidoglycan/xylan/chitin deacetylase (PgdA/CDA1 family)